jgi:hypothetical protein
LADAGRILENIVDLLEYIYILQPFVGTVTHLCEEARDHVLAESIVNTTVEGSIEELLRNLGSSTSQVERKTPSNSSIGAPMR